MSHLLRPGPEMTAAEFLVTDQLLFGDDWRYELVDGQIVAHAAPSPSHAVIIGNLAFAIKSRLRGKSCRLEIGSGAAPVDQQRPTARIPDVTIRCGKLPRVMFEVVSPSELRSWRDRDRKRRDEQGVEGVEEIVEVYQDQAAIHVYRRGGDAWLFDAVDDLDATLMLASIPIEIPLTEIYDGLDLTDLP